MPRTSQISFWWMVYLLGISHNKQYTELIKHSMRLEEFVLKSLNTKQEEKNLQLLNWIICLS